MKVKWAIAVLLCAIALGCAKGGDTNKPSNSNSQEDRAEGGRRQERRARRAVEEHLAAADPQFRIVKVDLFHTNPQYANKAYMAVSGSRPSVGNMNVGPETRAFLLVREGNDWKVAAGNQPAYTTKAEEADKILAAAN